MASTRTVCTECKQVVTLAEPAEVGDVATCPKCGAYFAVPRTKAAPPPGAAKPAAQPAKPMAARPVAAVPAKPKVVVAVEEDDDEDDVPRPKKRSAARDDDDDDDDDRPRKKKKGGPGKKKRKRRDDDEKSFRDSPLRYVILGVLVLIMGVGAYLLYKKEWTKPDLVIEATDPDLSKPITQAEKDAYAAKVKANQAQAKNRNAVDRNRALNELKQIGMAYVNYVDSNNRGPATLAELKEKFENNSKLADLITDGTYIVFMNVDTRNVPSGASNTILGYAFGANTGGGVVLFANGEVRNISKADFDAAPKAGR